VRMCSSETNELTQHKSGLGDKRWSWERTAKWATSERNRTRVGWLVPPNMYRVAVFTNATGRVWVRMLTQHIGDALLAPGADSDASPSVSHGWIPLGCWDNLLPVKSLALCLIRPADIISQRTAAHETASVVLWLLDVWGLCGAMSPAKEPRAGAPVGDCRSFRPSQWMTSVVSRQALVKQYVSRLSPHPHCRVVVPLLLGGGGGGDGACTPSRLAAELAAARDAPPCEGWCLLVAAPHRQEDVSHKRRHETTTASTTPAKRRQLTKGVEI
jgi:hypothetical protein